MEDIYEELKMMLDCDYISDLHNYKKEIYIILKDWEKTKKYGIKELNDVSFYIYKSNLNDLNQQSI